MPPLPATSLGFGLALALSKARVAGPSISLQSVCPRRRGLQRPRIRACLFPTTNAEADWVIVDVACNDIPDDMSSGPLVDQVTDDAKSLVRLALRDNSAELSVVLCSDAFIRSLNAQWRGKDAATDVLSFPQDDPDRVLLGDIVISVDTAAAQADERAYGLRDEVRVLLVHGLLHLLGYDHEGATEGDWLVMADMENRLLKGLGWAGEGLVSIAQPSSYRDIVHP